MTALQELANFVATGVRGRLAPATRATTALHVTDTVAAWVAGAHTPEGRKLLAMQADRRAGAEDDLPQAIALHCALARLSEVDDIHLASGVTPGGVVIPAVLTIAAALEETGSDALLEAIAAGTEAMVRLGLAIDGPTILYRGIWPTYFAAAFGVAAVAARLYDLDARETAHALALALSFASPGIGSHHDESTSRWFALGHAAQNGIIAARAAQAGFTSDLNLLDSGFFNGIYGITPNIGRLTAELGRRCAIDDTSIKPWCAARQTIAATQALLDIMADGIAPQTIAAIEVDVPPPFLKMVNHGVEAGNRASYLTSVQCRLALAACDRARLYDVGFAPPQLADDVTAVMQKISVAADPTLLAYYPATWPAKVVVHTSSGRHERLVTAVPGDPQLPSDARKVEDKFHRVLAPAAADYAEELLRHCRSLGDDNGSPAALVEAIARATG